MSNIELANIILQQLGGGRFAVMTGAKNMVAIKNGLQFDLPKTRGYVKDGISRLHIVLNASDTYTVKAYKIVRYEAKEIAEEQGIYCDMLRDIFEEMTGLRTSF